MLIFDNETIYWQQKYKENPNDPIFDDCCGETKALLKMDMKKEIRFWKIFFVSLFSFFFIMITLIAFNVIK